MRHLVSEIYSKGKETMKKIGWKNSQLLLSRPTEMPPIELQEESKSRAEKQHTDQQFIPFTFLLLYIVHRIPSRTSLAWLRWNTSFHLLFRILQWQSTQLCIISVVDQKCFGQYRWVVFLSGHLTFLKSTHCFFNEKIVNCGKISMEKFYL